MLVDGAPAPLPDAPGDDAAGDPVESLLGRGAEAVFAITDTYRYATWLDDVDRADEGQRLIESAADTAEKLK